MTKNGRLRRGAFVASITGLLVALASTPAIACDQDGAAAGTVEMAGDVETVIEAGVPVEVQAILVDEAELADPELTAVYPGEMASSVGGLITRAEIMSRARFWLGKALVYSDQGGKAPDPDGVLYRRDCSGFLSMAWHLSNADGGRNTRNLAEVASPVAGGRAGLQMGDMLLAEGYHAMLFVAQAENGRMTVIEFTPGSNMIERTKIVEDIYHPYRYNNLDESSPTPPDTRRVIVTNARGDVHVKEGALNAEWQTITTGMRKVVASGTRIVALDWAGNVHAKDGAVNAPWTTITGGAADVAVSGNRIAIINASGAVSVKEGPLNARWVDMVPAGATKVAVTDTTLAVMDWGVNVIAKVGPLDSSWLLVAEGVQDVAVSPNRLIVQHWGGAISVKEGSIHSGWIGLLNEGASSIAVSDSIVAFIDGSGNTNAKFVGTNAPWTAVAYGQVEIAASGSRLAVRDAAGLTRVMDFPSGLVTLGSGYTSVALS